MPQMFISNQEVQAGMKYGCVQGNPLTGVSIGTDDLIVEILIKRYEQDITHQKKYGTNDPYYMCFGNVATTHYITLIKSATGFTAGISDAGGALYGQSFAINDIYKDVLHILFLVRAASAIMHMNGHSIRTTAKPAHNIDSVRMWFFGSPWTGGSVTPGIGCLARLYLGNLSGFTDAQVLAIHRKYLQTPFVRIPELNTYLKFAWEGRQADVSPGVIGPAILDSATNLQNAITGENLLIQGGLTWGAIKAPIWTPR